MPIFNIFQSFISKQNQLYSDFLEAYNEVKQLKHIQNNLKTMAHCLVLEKNQGFSKCLNYYIFNGVDKVLLNLGSLRPKKPYFDNSSKSEESSRDEDKTTHSYTRSTDISYSLTPDLNSSAKSLRNKEYSKSTSNSPIHTDKTKDLIAQDSLEMFYISTLHIFDAEYFRSDFWNLIWRHGKFSKLCKYYCEKCVEHDIFNKDLALYLVELSLSDSLVLEGMVVVCELDRYCKHFESVGFGDILADNIESYASAMDERCIHMLSFACYYEDRSKIDLLDRISLRIAQNKSDAGLLKLEDESVKGSSKIGDVTVKDFFQKEDQKEKNKEKECYDKESNDRDTHDKESNDGFCEQLKFLLQIFKKVKSKRIRYKVLIEACNAARIAENPGNKTDLFSNFVLECIKIDNFVVGTALCKPEENHWSPSKILDYLMEDFSCENKEIEDSRTSETKSRSSVFSDDKLPQPKSFRNLEKTKVAAKNKDFSAYKENNSLQISFNFSSTDAKNTAEDTIPIKLENKKKQALLLQILGMDAVLVAIYLDKKRPLAIKRHDACLLSMLLTLKVPDTRIYIFLYCFDKQTFFNNFESILNLSDKREIISYVKEDLLLM